MRFERLKQFEFVLNEKYPLYTFKFLNQKDNWPDIPLEDTCYIKIKKEKSLNEVLMPLNMSKIKSIEDIKTQLSDRIDWINEILLKRNENFRAVKPWGFVNNE